MVSAIGDLGTLRAGERMTLPSHKSGQKVPAIRSWATWVGLALFAVLASPSAGRSDDTAPQLVPVARSRLCVTEGALEALQGCAVFGRHRQAARGAGGVGNASDRGALHLSRPNRRDCAAALRRRSPAVRA